MNSFVSKKTIALAHRNGAYRWFFLLLLVASIPLFVWAVLTQRLELRKKAATSEQPIVCWNRVITGEGALFWPDGCKGDPNAQVCTQVVGVLTPLEAYNYQQWVNAGRPYLPGCMLPTPSPAINWTSREASLTADDLSIQVFDAMFTGKPDINSPASIGSVPATYNNTTLTYTWYERGIPMAMTLFFTSDCSPSLPLRCSRWWVSEMHISDGKNPSKSFVYQNDAEFVGGNRPTAAWGQPFFTPELLLSSSGGGVHVVRFTNVTIQPFLQQIGSGPTSDCTNAQNGAACITASACPTCTAGSPCPAMACLAQMGACQNGICQPPPVGCSYQHVTCVRAPCNPVLVCTTPANGTPTPTPQPYYNTYCSGANGTTCCLTSGPNTKDCIRGICQNNICTLETTPTPTATNFNQPLCLLSSSIPLPSGPAPLTVLLHGGGSAGASPGIDGYRWDFDGNGIWDTEILPNAVSHTYSNNGLYQPMYQVHATNNAWSNTCIYPYQVVVGVSATATSTPTATPIPPPQTMKLRLKLSGVTDESATGANVAIKFLLQNGNVMQLSTPLSLAYAGNGIYNAIAQITNPFTPGTQFRINVKGEKHVAVTFCQTSGQTEPCTDTQYITVANATTDAVYDFTGIPLPPGDLSAQDGKANSEDLAKLTPLMSKLCADLTTDELTRGDVDYNGCVNVRDIFLILQTLETRYDQ